MLGAAAVAMSTAVCLTVLQAPAIATAATPTGSAPTFNLFIPGTWETHPGADPATKTGMLAPVADTVVRNHGDAATVFFLPYMARAFDNGQSYAASKATAVANASQVLREHAAAYPHARFTISGYSQGAHAAGTLAAAIGNGNGPISPDQVLAVGLLADPGAGTAGETRVGPATHGTGIAGPRPEGFGALSGRVVTIGHPDDLYTSINKTENPVLAQIGAVLGRSEAGASAAVQQAGRAAATFAAIDFAGITDNLGRLPQAIAVGDLHSAHRIAGTLNNQLNPLVQLAASVDWNAVSKTLALIPDQTGFAQAASAMAAVMARVDIVRTAELVGRIQELTWSAIGAVAPHAGAVTVPDLRTTPADLVHIVREFRAITAGFISGNGQANNGTGVSSDMRGLATAVTKIVATNGITNPAALINDAVRAAEFVRSTAHVDYGSLVVDGYGNTATQWLGSWLSTKIAQA